jgi:hypothetical protein
MLIQVMADESLDDILGFLRSFNTIRYWLLDAVPCRRATVLNSHYLYLD